MRVLNECVRQERMANPIFLLRTTASKDGAAHRSKAPTENGSFNVRINFAAYRSLTIRAVQSAAGVPEK
jgi:hypothetical protein